MEGTGSPPTAVSRSAPEKIRYYDFFESNLLCSSNRFNVLMIINPTLKEKASQRQAHVPDIQHLSLPKSLRQRQSDALCFLVTLVFSFLPRSSTRHDIV